MGHDNFDDVVAEAHSGMIAQQAHDADYDKLIRYCMLVNPQDGEHSLPSILSHCSR